MNRYKNFKKNNDKAYSDKMNSIYTKEDSFYLKIDIKKGMVTQEMCGDGRTGLYAIIKALQKMTNKMNLSKDLLFEIINDIYNGEE